MPLKTRVHQRVSCSGRLSPQCRTSWASQWSTLRWCNNHPPPISELRIHRKGQILSDSWNQNQSGNSSWRQHVEIICRDVIALVHLHHHQFQPSLMSLTTFYPSTDRAETRTCSCAHGKMTALMRTNTSIRLIWEEKENTPQVKAWMDLMNTTMSGRQNKVGFQAQQIWIYPISAHCSGANEEKRSNCWLFCVSVSCSVDFTSAAFT